MLRFHLSTFLFQLLNFFILLAALHWFLYRPLLRVMKARENDINARLREAEEQVQGAKREREALAHERQQAQADAEEVMARARDDAARQRLETLEEARRQAARYLDEARRRTEEQERAARQVLEAEARHTAVAVAAGLLGQVRASAQHEALVTQLLEGNIDEGEQLVLLRRALTSPGHPTTVELALPASPELQARVRGWLSGLRGDPGDERTVAFRVEPSLIAGLRILVGTVVLELSLRAQLARLEQEKPTQGATA